jgi:hypothetical protein
VLEVLLVTVTVAVAPYELPSVAPPAFELHAQ